MIVKITQEYEYDVEGGWFKAEVREETGRFWKRERWAYLTSGRQDHIIAVIKTKMQQAYYFDTEISDISRLKHRLEEMAKDA